jgi:TRAP-type C4-dicarboxylate transport system substrate-binding protein
MQARDRIGPLSLFLVASAVAIAGVAPVAQAQATKLRFAHTVSTEDTSHRAIVEFAKKVKERTGGRVEVEIYPAAQLGNDPKVLEGVRLGTIDAGMTGNPFFSSFAPELNVLDLPYLFRDYDLVF